MSEIKTTRFIRKPFVVNAIQVTVENMKKVADRCGGEILSHFQKGRTSSVDYIKVPVPTPKNERQTRAYVGDWVLALGKGYRVYTDQAFKRDFVDEDTSKSTDSEFEPMKYDKVRDLVKFAMRKQDEATYTGCEFNAHECAESVTRQIMNLV